MHVKEVVSSTVILEMPSAGTYQLLLCQLLL